MDKHRVSIVIPFYKTEKYLARCLDSIFHQSHVDLEIILVNDGSPDDSLEIVKGYASFDSRIRILHNATNMGTMKARELGYRNATGDFLFFLDSDDYLVPNAIELLLSRQKDTDADIVAGGLLRYMNGSADRHYPCSLPYGNLPENVFMAIFRRAFPVSMCAKLFKRSLFTEYSYRNFPGMIISEDSCLLHQLIDNAKYVDCISDCIYCCDDNPYSSTHQKYTLKHIDNMLTAHEVKLSICGKYPSLVKDLEHSLTFHILRLYAVKCPTKEIRVLIDKHNLTQYASWRRAIRVLTPRQLLGTLAAVILKSISFNK